MYVVSVPLGMASEKRYCVVFFPSDHATTYMHHTWLCGTEKQPKTYWPATGGKVDQKLIASPFPGGTNGWTKLDVEILAYGSKHNCN